MPWMTAAIFGAVAAIRSRSVSSPLTTYWSWHGWPNGDALAQFSMISVKPMSLPPIWRVTTRVVAVVAGYEDRALHALGERVLFLDRHSIHDRPALASLS